MSDSPEEFLKLRRAVEELRRAVDRADGALERIAEELRRDFGCASRAEAEALLDRLRREEAEAAEAYRAAAEAFDAEWGGLLEKFAAARTRA